MKRIILIVTIALLPVLSACFFGRVRIKPGQAPNLVPKVRKNGTLENLKDDKGRSLFKKPIQEGFYVSYRVGCCKEKHVFYAIGDRVSYPKMSYSGYQEKINGAGVTSKNGLNVTSWFIFDKSKMRLTAYRAIVNLSRETIYLSEVKDYIDTNLLPLSTKIGSTIVEPLPRGTDTEVEPLPRGTDMAIRSSLTFGPDIATENCWPCKAWPDCIIENAVPDLTRATVICIDCDKNTAGLVHVVCLADLKQERDEYGEEEVCDHQITFVGIDARPDRLLNDDSCPPPPSQERTLATRKEWSERDVEEALTLKTGSAVAIKTEYKINLPTK